MSDARVQSQIFIGKRVGVQSGYQGSCKLIATGLTVRKQSNGYIKYKCILAAGSPPSCQSSLPFLSCLIKENPFRRMAEHVSLASERALGATGEWAHMPIVQIFWGFPISNFYSNEEGIWVLGLQRRESLNLCQRDHLPSHLPLHIEWPEHLPDRGQVAPAHTRNCSIKKTTMRFSCSPWQMGENILNLRDFIL